MENYRGYTIEKNKNMAGYRYTKNGKDWKYTATLPSAYFHIKNEIQEETARRLIQELERRAQGNE